MVKTFKVVYYEMVDDALYKAIGAINELLKEKNIELTIEYDKQPQDGFTILIVKLIEK